jgi:hypothetical protein
MKQSIADVLRDQSVINALAADRAARIARTLQQSLGRVEGLTIADVQDRMRREVSEPASKAIALVDKYSKGGSHCTVLETLRGLRHRRLAHRQTEAMPVTPSWPR